jgi:hypothetical protein
MNEGAIAEQFIGQHLLTAQKNSPSLHYWVRQARTAGFSLLSLPLYLLEALPKVLDEIREQASCTARIRAANLQP